MGYTCVPRNEKRHNNNRIPELSRKFEIGGRHIPLAFVTLLTRDSTYEGGGTFILRLSAFRRPAYHCFLSNLIRAFDL